MNILSKKFNEIGKLELIKILADVKQEICLLEVNDVIKFKLEFILEELITNSFSYLVREYKNVSLRIDIDVEPFRVKYIEIGVDDFDFHQHLNISKNSFSPQRLLPGGLGLSLINNLSLEFSYRYDLNERSRYYQLKI